MSTEVTVAHSQAWHNGYYMLAQQRRSRFRRFVRTDGEVKGKWAWFNRIGVSEMVERTSRHQDTNLVDTPHSRRGCSMKDYELGDLVDPQDLHRLISNPQNSYVRSAVNAANRRTDITILRAVNGATVSADEDDAQTSNALPSAQKIAVGGTGLTLSKIKEARKILYASEVVEPDDMPILPFAVTAEQMDDLLGITEFKSIEFNDSKAIGMGRVARGMGFEFIETERLETDSSGSRLNLAWVPAAIGYREPDGPVKTSVDPRPDKGKSIQVLAQKTCGGCRIEDVAVVEIACSE